MKTPRRRKRVPKLRMAVALYLGPKGVLALYVGSVVSAVLELVHDAIEIGGFLADPTSAFAHPATAPELAPLLQAPDDVLAGVLVFLVALTAVLWGRFLWRLSRGVRRSLATSFAADFARALGAICRRLAAAVAAPSALISAALRRLTAQVTARASPLERPPNEGPGLIPCLC